MRFVLTENRPSLKTPTFEREKRTRLYAEKSVLNLVISSQILDCNYSFPSDSALTGIPFDCESDGKVKLRSKFSMM